ncbi:hypothetical protein N0V95_007799 [Ascochyta clinopodiicola]|nr:hypothetical protein N0V95_007799 [Ascochyta clinopodiicola]
MKLLTLLSSLGLITSAASSPLEISKRQQSTTWRYTCSALTAPTNFLAFNLPSCTAQLSHTKDRYIGIQWAFEATYADGTRQTHTPFRDLNGFGVSDTFYP